MNAFDDDLDCERTRGALDRQDIIGCPTCWMALPVHKLCEHDDPMTGPVCLDICCQKWHGKDAA